MLPVSWECVINMMMPLIVLVMSSLYVYPWGICICGLAPTVQCNCDFTLIFFNSVCYFSTTRHDGGDVSLDGQVVVQKDTFRY